MCENGNSKVPKLRNSKNGSDWRFVMRVDNSQKYLEYCEKKELNGQSLRNAVGGRCRRMCRMYANKAIKCPYKIQLVIATGEVYERNEHNHHETITRDEQMPNDGTNKMPSTDDEEEEELGREEGARNLNDRTNTTAPTMNRKRSTRNSLSTIEENGREDKEKENGAQREGKSRGKATTPRPMDPITEEDDEWNTEEERRGQQQTQQREEQHSTPQNDFYEPQTGNLWHFLATVENMDSLTKLRQNFGLMKLNGSSKKKIWLKCSTKDCPYRGLFLEEKNALFDRSEHFHDATQREGPKPTRRKTDVPTVEETRKRDTKQKMTRRMTDIKPLARQTDQMGMAKLARRRTDMNLGGRENEEKRDGQNLNENKNDGDGLHFLLCDLEQEFIKLREKCQLMMYKDKENKNSFALGQKSQKITSKMLLFTDEDASVLVTKWIGQNGQEREDGMERWPKAGSQQFVHAMHGICAKYFGFKIDL